MYLKSLTLKGFKSFAQPTTFAFEPGVTCVVGPNGSGKSNVVDALAWVMGEQGAKTLRGGSMEDVIFAGTTTKAPLGRAEVLLTIDNSDGALPIEYAEVTISRTLFRNGGSEYAINKEPCRLLDVQELLSDSGLGREMHVIVGQGQLDQVLHASPEDRRRFIEEAAGILKHRRRKEKTQRKLESMQANLTRLNDLAGEIRRQLTPLGRQAEIAQQAQSIQAIARDAKARLLADEVQALSVALQGFHADEQERAAERTALADQLGGLRRRIDVLESGEDNAALDAARSVDYALRGVYDRLMSLQSLASERANALEDAPGEESTLGEITDGDLATGRSDVEMAHTQVGTHEETVGQISARLATHKASLETLDSQISHAMGLLGEYNQVLRTKQAQVELQQSLVEAQNADVARQVAALEQASERVSLAQSALTEAHGDSTVAPDTVAQAYEKELAEAEAALALADTKENETRTALHQQEREQEALAAKVSALELALRSDRADGDVSGQPGITGSVSDALEVRPGYETAIARALGSLAEAYLVDTHDDAWALVAKREGDASSRMDLVVASAKSVAQSPRDGVIAATELVKGPSGVLALLVNTYVANDVAAAKKAWSSKGFAGSGVTLVTMAGDVFSDYTIRTGSGEAPSRLELIAERDAAEAAVQKLSIELERTRFGATEAARAKTEAAEAAKASLARLRDADAMRAQYGEQVSRTRASLEAAQAEVIRLGQAVEAAKTALAHAQHAVETASNDLATFAATDKPAVDETSRVALLALVEATSAEEVDARIALESARARAKSATDAVALLEQRQKDQLAAREQEKVRASARLAKAVRARTVLELLPDALHVAQAAVSDSADALIGAEASRQAAQGELVELRAGEASSRERLSAITDSVHNLEMHLYEKKLQRTNLLARVSEELSLDEKSLMDDYAPDVLVPSDEHEGDSVPYVRSEQEARLKKAQRGLDQLGRVNPLALEEFNALEQRHTFLRDQLLDLGKTRKDLESIMAELDESMQTIFREAFEDTQKAFDEVFPLLFPGGTGALHLTDGDDLLTTGIEVTVKPAGKKIDRLSLLSGGERSLAAVALLIAIFKARPSPFYILDEIEAALDDANLGRLLAVIESLREGSQLIVITHQKRTMEIADALYGVSMRKDGVSAVVGQRVRDSEALAS